jgi:hypothetical protein
VLTNVHEIDQATYKQVLDFNINTGRNVLALGMAGTGKTEMAQQACDRWAQATQRPKDKPSFIYLNLSVLEAPDLIGLPIITPDKRVDYATPKFFPRADDATSNGLKFVLIVDELDKAKPELQNPLLELFQFHSINGTPLDIQAIIATGNLPEEGAFSQPISMALTNRCKVYKLSHNFEAWREWAQENNVNPLVIGFLSKNQEYLCMPNVEGDPTAYCRPSPRSWAWAADDLNKTDPKVHSVDFQSMLVAGRVGTAAAVKFRTWLDYYRHVEPHVEKLWDTGNDPSIPDMTIDKQLVMAIAAVDMVAQECRKTPKTPADKQKQLDAVQKGAKNVFGWVRKLSAEFQVGAVKSTLNMKLIQDFQLTKIKEVMETYLNVRKAMKD